MPSDRGGKHEFVSLVRDLSPPGELGAPVSEEKKEEEERGVKRRERARTESEAKKKEEKDTELHQLHELRLSCESCD